MEPDQLLTIVNRLESRKGQGKFKIFLGMVAGVGKTYAMLKAAHEMKREGLEVVAGFVEPHGRKETSELIRGLEVFPRKQIAYRGVFLEEMDVDGLIKRKPTWVLVDELAHTNAPGSAHPKRYLDVFDLLDHGINILGTVNIQHLESRAQTVREITGVQITETIPDAVIDRADEIVLIDLAPEELLKRLKSGRIYPDAIARKALQNFFKEGNLTALRELSLRMLAERVDQDLRDLREIGGIKQRIWKTGTRLMVAVYASPYSEAMIRWARRSAYLVGAPWIGAYVDRGLDLSEEEAEMLQKNLDLVRSLGGQVVQTQDSDIVSGLLRLAREHQATQLIIGKSDRRSFWNFFGKRTMTQRLLEESEELDVYIVGRESFSFSKAGRKFRRRAYFPKELWPQLVLGTFLILGLTGMNFFLVGVAGYRTLGLFYLVFVTLAALRSSLPTLLWMTFLSGALWNYIFIPPRFSWTIASPHDWVIYGSSLFAIILISVLTLRLRAGKERLQERENRVSWLFQLTRALSQARSVDEVIQLAVDHIHKSLESQIVVYLKKSESHLPDVHPLSESVPNPRDEAAAFWVARHGRVGGKNTDNLPNADYTYFPIPALNGTLGAIGVKAKDRQGVRKQHWDLLENICRQVGISLEREILHDRIKQSEVFEESEKLYQTILSSVSHELKTPLATIQGSASALQDPLILKNPEAPQALVGEILDATERMKRLVRNLLDMSRLESGRMKIRLLPCDLRDLVARVVHQAQTFIGATSIDVVFDKTFSLAEGDEALLEQAIYNIVQNSILHNTPDVPIAISGSTKNDYLEIIIEDQGKGLPEPTDQIFQKFYRSGASRTGGSGLGLTITRAIVELHQGEIRAENRKEGGARIIMRIPRFYEPKEEKNSDHR
jgi:two-component system sensor histidine kinase KdpD